MIAAMMKSARRPPTAVLLAATGVAAACALTALGVLHPPVTLTWNATASIPIGLYYVSKATQERGELVLAEVPSSVRALAAERRYLPSGVHLAKRIAAISGDSICADNDVISINGVALAQRQPRDSQGRDMPGWAGCRVLTDEVFLLLPDVAASFDGRYFGPIPAHAVIGKMTPLWTRTFP